MIIMSLPHPRQVVHLLTPLETRHSSLSFSLKVRQNFTGDGSWRAHHDPPLDDTVAELHCPRFIT